MMLAAEIRERARLRAQGHRNQLAALIHEATLEDEMKDAMRVRLRGLWTEANIAMTLVDTGHTEHEGDRA